MDWDLARTQDGVFIERITNYRSSPTGHGRSTIGLQPGLVGQEFPKGETPKQANLFITKFMEVNDNFPASKFRALGWLHSVPSAW